MLAISFILMMSVLMVVSGCSTNDNAQTRQIDNYSLSVTTDPEKLVVGSDAEVTMKVEKDNEDMEACHPRFRQYVPSHPMTTDNVWHEMESLQKGLYRGRGTEFSIAGDWKMEIGFNCGDGMKTVVFPFTLEWM